MNINDILLIVFASIGVVGVIAAYIYTKFIKPDNLSYTSTSLYVKFKYRLLVKKLRQENKISSNYAGVAFKHSDGSTIYIDYMLMGNEKIYLMSFPLYWNISRVQNAGNRLKYYNKKDKEFEAPLDVQLFWKSAKAFRKLFEAKDNVVIITPCLNKEFKQIQFNNHNFVPIDKLDSFISSFENSSENKLTDLQAKILAARIKRKPKRRILPQTKKSTDFVY